jgi:hypothetical protein
VLALLNSHFERADRHAGASLVRPIQDAEVFADDFFAGVTDDFLGDLVPTGHVAVGIKDEYRVIRDAFDENLKVPFGAFLPAAISRDNRAQEQGRD